MKGLFGFKTEVKLLPPVESNHDKSHKEG